MSLGLAVPTTVGQRLDCGHIVAKGKPAYPHTASWTRWFCSHACLGDRLELEIKAMRALRRARRGLT